MHSTLSANGFGHFDPGDEAAVLVVFLDKFAVAIPRQTRRTGDG